LHESDSLLGIGAGRITSHFPFDKGAVTVKRLGMALFDRETRGGTSTAKRALP
jgi:hypothetical protein